MNILSLKITKLKPHNGYKLKANTLLLTKNLLARKKCLKMNLTEVGHEGHTYPAGAVCGGKLLICEIKQFVWITSIQKSNL